MSEMKEVSSKVEFGGHSVDFDAVPRHVQIGFFARTFAHKLGNEVEAAVVSRIKTALGDPNASKEAVSVWRSANADQIAAWQTELRGRLVGKILDGSVGVRESNGRASAPRDPVAEKFEELVLAEMRPILDGLGYTKRRVKMDDTLRDSMGNAISIQRLHDAIATEEGHPLFKGATLRATAEKEVAAQARKAQRSAGMNLAELGL